MNTNGIFYSKIVNMDQIVEVKYDSQFNQIENLTWYPWVGKDYEDGKRRILIVGESHYIDEDIEDEGKLREQEVKVDKYHTRNCLYEVLVDKSWCNRTYPNLMEALCDRGIISEDKLVLSKIAFIILSKDNWIIPLHLRNVPILMIMK